MYCLAFLRKTKLKKMGYELKIFKFFMNCSFYWQVLASRIFGLPKTISCSTKYSSVVHLSCLNYNSFKTCYKPNWLTKGLIRSALMPYVWDSKRYKNLTLRFKKSELQSCKKAEKKLIRYSTTRGYLICKKSSVPSWLIGITMTFLKVILELIKLESWSAR